ncbi:MAG: carboxypeptidase-like regulatory domain-containing protein [Armatimonadota bacterium]
MLQRNRFTLLLLAVWVALTLVQMWPAHAEDAQFGMLKVIVQLADGAPYPGVTEVVVKIGEKELKYNTGADGTFTRLVPAGPATVTVGGKTENVTVAAGEATTVKIQVKQVGAMLTVTYPDNMAVSANCEATASYKTAAGEKNVSAMPMGQGRFWFRDVPADMTAMSVILRISGGRADASYRKQWTFEKPEELRALTMTIGKPVHVQIAIVDAAGAVVTDAQVKGRISYQSAQPRFWDVADQPASTYASQMPLRNVQTDANGVLDLGLLPVRKYEITLRAGEKAGGPVTFEVKEDGTVSIAKYALELRTRTITQIALGSDGKPVPNTELSASYSWLGKVVFTKATSDAAGKVVWKDIPPTRMIVWGKGVATGVIPPDATEVKTVLPAPTTTGNGRSYRVSVENPGDQPMKISWIYRSTDSYSNSNQTDYQPGNNNSASFQPYLQGGSPFNLLVMTNTTPPRIASLSNVYIPYSDEEDTAGEISVRLQDGVGIHARFVTAGGKPVIGLSRLQVLPVKVGDYPSLLNEDALRNSNIMRPVENRDGTYSVALPAAGTYRFVVDLFDQATVPPPALLVDVAQGLKEATITLPEPIVTVAPGTQLNWITRIAPADTKQLVVTARATAMPVFGPKEQILALWYRPAPDKLVVWNPEDAEKLVKTLTLRSVNLVPQQKDGSPYSSYTRLMPLLPVPVVNRSYDSSADTRARSDSMSIAFGRLDNPGRVDIWSGKYVVNVGGDREISGTLDIPAEGDTDVIVKIDTSGRRPLNRNQYRGVRLKFPQADYQALRKNSQNNIAVICDVPNRNNNSIGTYDIGRNDVYFSLPTGAKTFTLIWPGIGVMKDVAIPQTDPNGEQPVITLPAWDAGVALSGKVINAEGKPYAKLGLAFSSGLGESRGDSWRVQTDENGQFSLKGILPGPIFVFSESGNSGGWSLEVPEKGLADVTLRQMNNPVRIPIYYGGGSESRAVWFIPDTGKPSRLPARWSEVVLHEPPSTTGWVWVTDNSDGRGMYRRYSTGMDRSSDSRQAVTGPSLGFTFPYDPEIGTPGAVTIEGQGNRADFKSIFSNFTWQPCAMLGKVVGQIDAVPPGTYKVTVETTRGKIEEIIQVTDFGGYAELEPPAAVAGPAR